MKKFWNHMEKVEHSEQSFILELQELLKSEAVS